MPSIVYVINNTQGQLITAIQPTGENLSASDLRLYGLGHLQWGEGVDENQYHLTENFACPEKSGSPGNPQDESDLGAGNGINNPVNGQLWFNTTQKRIFVFDSTIPGWKIVGGGSSGPIPPLSSQVGDLWFDTTIPQLKIWDGFNFVSVADRYVLKAGDTMTGVLAMSSNKITGLADGTASGDALHFGQLGTQVQAQDDDLDALAALTTTGILVRTGPGTATTRTLTSPSGNIIFTNPDGVAGNPDLNLVNIGSPVVDSFRKITTDAKGRISATTPVNDADIGAVVDGRYVNTTGDTMTGQLNVPLTPTAAAHAASKQYVDSLSTSFGNPFIFANRPTLFFATGIAGCGPSFFFVDATPFVPAGATGIIVSLTSSLGANPVDEGTHRFLPAGGGTYYGINGSNHFLPGKFFTYQANSCPGAFVINTLIRLVGYF